MGYFFPCLLQFMHLLMVHPNERPVTGNIRYEGVPEQRNKSAESLTTSTVKTGCEIPAQTHGPAVTAPSTGALWQSEVLTQM